MLLVFPDSCHLKLMIDQQQYQKTYKKQNNYKTKAKTHFFSQTHKTTFIRALPHKLCSRVIDGFLKYHIYVFKRTFCICKLATVWVITEKQHQWISAGTRYKKWQKKAGERGPIKDDDSLHHKIPNFLYSLSDYYIPALRYRRIPMY